MIRARTPPSGGVLAGTVGPRSLDGGGATWLGSPMGDAGGFTKVVRPRARPIAPYDGALALTLRACTAHTDLEVRAVLREPA